MPHRLPPSSPDSAFARLPLKPAALANLSKLSEVHRLLKIMAPLVQKNVRR